MCVLVNGDERGKLAKRDESFSSEKIRGKTLGETAKRRHRTHGDSLVIRPNSVTIVGYFFPPWLGLENESEMGTLSHVTRRRVRQQLAFHESENGREIFLECTCSDEFLRAVKFILGPVGTKFISVAE